MPKVCETPSYQTEFCFLWNVLWLSIRRALISISIFATKWKSVSQTDFSKAKRSEKAKGDSHWHAKGEILRLQNEYSTPQRESESGITQLDSKTLANTMILSLGHHLCSCLYSQSLTCLWPQTNSGKGTSPFRTEHHVPRVMGIWCTPKIVSPKWDTLSMTASGRQES